MDRPEWLDQLIGDSGRREEIATEMLLAALRASADRESYAMCRRLIASGEATLADLEAVSGLSRIAVVERIDVMTQVGLVRRDIETGRVRPTALASGLVGILERIRSAFLRRIEEGVPRLDREER